MKTKTFAGLVLLFALYFTACGRKETTSETTEVTKTEATKDALLILIDKTISSTPSNDRQEAFLKYTTQRVIETLQQPGDCVRGHFVQENTAGTPAFLRSGEVPAFRAPESGGGKSLESAKLKHAAKLKNLHGSCNKQLRSGVTLVNTTGTQLQTDLWGTLEVASRLFSEADYQNMEIVILSDMEESMPGANRRDFYTNPIKSKTEAQAFAEADVSTLQKLLDIDEEVLVGTKITIFPPFDALQDSHFAFNRYYWEALLGKLGVAEVSVK